MKTARRLTPETRVHTLSLQTVLDAAAGRLALDVAFDVAHACVKAVEATHARGLVLGTLDATSFELNEHGVLSAGHLRGARLAPELKGGAEADILSDLYALGVVLYQCFTGVTPAQARGQLVVPTIYEVPRPSSVNPALDESLDALLLSLLEKDPAERLFSASAALSLLTQAAEELGLELGTESVTHLFRPQPPAPKAAPVLKRVATPAPSARWADDEEDEDDEDFVADAEAQPVRFDAWAAASLGVVAVAIALVTVL